ncbi:MAG: tetratricopeptide repeat protein [Planctomycetota bacterium]
MRSPSSRLVLSAALALGAALAPACAGPALHTKELRQEPPPASRPKADLTDANTHFSAGRFAEAAKAYEAALEVDPTSGVAWFRLGYSLHAIGELERAIPAHEKALQHPQFAPTAAYNLACAHALLGDVDGAFEALGIAAQRGFSDAQLARTDTDLAALRGDPRWQTFLDSLSAPAPDDVLTHLNFWVGDWVVKSATGQVLGTNRITSQLGGHLVFEEWTSANGGTGKSMNYWDRDAEQWKQVWIDAGGSVLNMAGNFVDGAMRFEGRHMYKSGDTIDHRTTLTPLADGRVRQFIEESRDDKATWTATFDGYYSPRETAEEGEGEER